MIILHCKLRMFLNEKSKGGASYETKSASYSYVTF